MGLFGSRRSRRARRGGIGHPSSWFRRRAKRPASRFATGPTLRQRVVPVLFVIALLALAPAFAHAQSDSVVVRWTSPGDDRAIGTATSYDLRVSEAPITAGNFHQAQAVTGLPSPAHSGTAQRVPVFGLTPGHTYYFAIRTVDNAGNWSLLSNLVQFDWTLDTSPPSAPHEVQAVSAADGIHLHWAANAEADLAGYNLYRRINSGIATRLNSALLTSAEFVDTTAPQDPQGVIYQVTAVDRRGNESARAQVTQIAVGGATAWLLKPGYPNPSRLGQSVRIPVVVPASASGSVTVQILDSGGSQVRHLMIANPIPGSTEVTWDGMNDAGRATAPGVYRGWLVAGDTRSSVRLVRVP